MKNNIISCANSDCHKTMQHHEISGTEQVSELVSCLFLKINKKTCRQSTAFMIFMPPPFSAML